MVENSGSFPLSNNTFKRGDDLTLLLIGVTPTELVLFELENTVLRNRSEALLDMVGLLLGKLLAPVSVTLVRFEQVVAIPLTAGTVSLC